MPGPAVDAALDADLTSRTLDLAADLLAETRAATGRLARRRENRLGRLLTGQDGTRLVFSVADRVLRPSDHRVAARQLAALTTGSMPGLGALDRAMLRGAGLAARAAPGPVVAMVGARLRRQTAELVLPSESDALRRRLARLRTRVAGGVVRPNLNLLGEAVLGEDEAARRAAAVEGLLRRVDVDCVSVKVSSIASGLSLVDLEGSVQRVAAPLSRLYRVARDATPPKLVNLDMEEHKDLDLTVAVFTRVLGRPEFDRLVAGIALQAYLPDSHDALEEILAFGRSRIERGAAPVRVRLVKGANLAMERVDAELNGWVQAPYASKTETDASFKRLLFRLVEAAEHGGVLVGAASHNLFDVALALQLASDRHVPLDIEMLTGMADGQVAAVARRAGHLLVYVPVTSRRDFRNALAYLARRLDENATPEGFLRHVHGLHPGTAAWTEQAELFVDALRIHGQLPTVRRQHQDRRAGIAPLPAPPAGGVVNEPDTDLTVPANRFWALQALAAADRRVPGPPPASVEAVQMAVTRARAAAATWSALDPSARCQVLERVAEEMVAGRAEAVAVMASEAGKTFSEADPEVSEAIDYARWYGRAGVELDALAPDVPSAPLGVVVVASPWNFPYAIPAGGVLAALAAGNAALLKPSPETVATASLLVEQLHAAGIPTDVVQLLPVPDGPAGQALVGHAEIGAVILTGSLETARMFRRWSPAGRLLAETSGKNSIVVDGTADVDQAVHDVVRSAFGHAGQKCSAASLVIVDASLYDEGSFLRQLADAVRSLRVGMANDPRTEVGPIVGPLTPSLERALRRLDPGEAWLVTPRRLDHDRHLWSPGIRLGVQPGSWAHLTEWFGPVLGVMRSRSTDEASAWQNAVPFGLTAGLQSLDPGAHRLWAERTEAGNLYINRPTTGAIVGRQPFGGWKGSSLGPTAKTGGPNYLIGLRRWGEPGSRVPLATVRESYHRWWDREFALERELAGLAAESNTMRYRPYGPGVLLRSGPGAPPDDIARARQASELTGTPLTVSSADDESAVELAARMEHLSDVRLRLLGRPEPEVVRAAAEVGMTVLDEPVCPDGRVELVRWLREQVVTRSLHRYGNVVYDRWTPAR